MDEGIVRAIKEAGRDDVGAQTRQEITDAVTTALQSGGQLLWVGGYISGTDRRDGVSPFGFGDDATTGLATVMQTAGELMAASSVLLREDHRYAAAALIRQLVEVEYLAWAFAEDEEEARNWMRSSKENRRRIWQPQHIRERAGGRFRGSDYGEHCGRGGHPSPEGLPLLPDHTSPEGFDPLWRCDLLLHGLSVWKYAISAAGKLGYADQLGSIDKKLELQNAKSRWREVDPLVLAIETAQAKRADPG